MTLLLFTMILMKLSVMKKSIYGLVDDEGREEIKIKIVELGGDIEAINNWICDNILCTAPCFLQPQTTR